MKIQIDTKEKTISVLDDTNIKELVKTLKEMLGDEYEEYTIKKTEVIGYTYYYPWYQWYPLGNPTWITTTGQSLDKLPSETTIYNVEVIGKC